MIIVRMVYTGRICCGYINTLQFQKLLIKNDMTPTPTDACVYYTDLRGEQPLKASINEFFKPKKNTENCRHLVYKIHKEKR